MNTPAETLAEWQQRLRLYKADLERPLGEIVRELSRPPPRQTDEQLTLARLRHIDTSIVNFNTLLRQFTIAYSAASSATSDQEQKSNWQALSREFNFIRGSVHQWHAVRSLVKEQVQEPRTSLIRRRGAKLSPRDIQDRLADDLFNALHVAITERQQDQTLEKLGAFPDIGLYNSAFTELLQAAYRLRLILGAKESRFLDVGCGAGIKVMGAARFFHDVAGLELDPGYIAVARDLLDRAHLGRAELIHGDALNFQNYANYNVIYFFRPLRDDDKLLMLERKITEAAKNQTILIAPYAGFVRRHREYNCQQIAGHLFILGGTRKEARELKRQAEYCGLAVQPPHDPLAGIWQPILKVAHENGFDLMRRGRLDGA